jgi:hypothetical protein
VILTERSEVDGESRRQPAVFIARLAGDDRTRALPFVAVVGVEGVGRLEVGAPTMGVPGEA